LLLVACLVVLGSSQVSYTTVSGWSELNCAGDAVAVVTIIDPSGTTCTPSGCVNNNNNLLPNTPSSQVTCGSDPFPFGQLPGDVIYNSSDCTGVVVSHIGTSKSLCQTSGGPGQSRFEDPCDPSGGQSFSTPNCTGQGQDLNIPGLPVIQTCIPGTPTGLSSKLVCGAVCFHEDTAIIYQGNSYTMSDLKNSHLCAIPHIVKSNGVKISSTCPGHLRLTHNHLVYTHDGLVAAGTIKVGDFLFSDMNEKVPCEVTKVEQEYAQTYFGLNCEDSDVLASGYKTSTFGIFHAVPAMWMKYGSKVLGIHSASALGDSVASLLSTFGFI